MRTQGQQDSHVVSDALHGCDELSFQSGHEYLFDLQPEVYKVKKGYMVAALLNITAMKIFNPFFQTCIQVMVRFVAYHRIRASSRLRRSDVLSEGRSALDYQGNTVH